MVKKMFDNLYKLDYLETLKKRLRNSPLFNFIKRWFVEPLDFFLTLILMPLFFLFYLFLKIIPTGSDDDKERLIIMTFGGGLNTQKEKYGDYQELINWVGPIETFDEVFWLMYRGNSTGWTQISSSIKAYEQKRVFFVFHYLASLLILVKGCWIVKRYNVKAILSRDPFRCGFCGWCICKLTNTACITFLAGDYEKNRKYKNYWDFFGCSKITNLVKKWTITKADRVLVPFREYQRQRVIDKYNLNDGIVKIYPLALDPGDFKTNKLNLPKKWEKHREYEIISFAGRISPENYIDDALDIIKNVHERHRNIRFLVAGGGQYEKQFKSKITNENLAEFVISLGWIPRENVYPLRYHSTVSLVLKGGKSLIEAAACSSPIITYDIEWHDEIVKEGETGYLVEEGNIAKAAELLISIIKKPKKQRQMGEKAKKVAFEKYGLKQATTKKDKFYSNLLNEFYENQPS